MSIWKEAADLVLPEDGKPHSKQWYAWTGFSVIVLWFFFWWSLGFAPSVFGMGFARAEDTQLNTQLIIEASLLDQKIKQCLAVEQDTKIYYTREMLRLKTIYYQTMGYRYDEPSCSTIIVYANDVHR